MPEIAHVDPVEPEPRRARGKRPRRASRGIRMDFRQATVADQPSVGALAPVIEVAGDDERRIVRHFTGDEFEKPVDLPPAVRLPQSEVQADGMQWNITACQSDYRVQQASRLCLANGRIHVAPRCDGMLGKECVAVMPARRDGVLPVGVLRPHAVRENLVLLHGRLRTLSGPDFLEEYEVRLGGSQGIAYAQEGFVAAPRPQALVRVQRQHADPAHFISAGRSLHAPTLYRGA